MNSPTPPLRPSPEDPLHYALIGCGAVGRKRAAALAPGQLLVAHDADQPRAAALAASHPGCTAATDPAAALADPRVHAVIIAVTNDALAPLALAAIRAGKAVLLEKPGAVNAGQLRALQEAAIHAGTPVRLGYNHRFHPGVQRLRSLVDTGALGPLFAVRARYGHGGRTGYEREWRADRARSGGGSLIDQGVHLIDLAAWLLGDLTVAQGHVATLFWDMPVEDNAFVSLRSATGATAWLHASCTEWKNLFSLEVSGRLGKATVEGLGGSYGPERCTWHKLRAEPGPPETTVWEFPGPDCSWREELAAFEADLRTGRAPEPGLAQGLRTLEIVEQIYRLSGFPLNETPLPPADDPAVPR